MLIFLALFASQLSYGQASYEKSIELAGGPALDTDTKYSLGAYTTHGMKLNNLFFGAGIGFRCTEALYQHSTTYRHNKSLQIERSDHYIINYLIPLYARAFYQFGSSKLRPIIMFDLGYTINVVVDDIYQRYKNIEGLFYEPSVGAAISIEKKTVVYLTLGINYQNAHHLYRSYDDYDITSEEIEINGMAPTLNFRVAIAF